MVINSKTLTRTVLPFMDEATFDELVEKCPEVQLEKPLLEMTCGEFIQTLDENYPLNFFKETYIMDAIGKLKSYRSQMEQIERYMKLNEFKTSSEEERAQIGVHFPSFAERILLTVTEFFHLHSFDEAENVPFSNYLVVMNAKNADAKYERNYNQIIENKHKTKNK